jgi:hypothetical protein
LAPSIGIGWTEGTSIQFKRLSNLRGRFGIDFPAWKRRNPVAHPDHRMSALSSPLGDSQDKPTPLSLFAQGGYETISFVQGEEPSSSKSDIFVRMSTGATKHELGRRTAI